ncbi:MAG: gamma-glutamylcyclotransferase, partial [Myxococcota bacterium]
VFAYGSLMSEPALPAHLVGRQRAVLSGWRRVFQQQSRTRGCPPDAVPEVPAVPGFVSAEGVRYSLALGLVEDPRSVVVGVCCRYDGADAVLAELERREGPGYEARELEVETSEGTQVVWTWVSRTGHPRVVDLPVREQARVLLAGTPTRDIDGRARGVHYLFDVASTLEGMGEPDPNLAELLLLTRPLPGS